MAHTLAGDVMRTRLAEVDASASVRDAASAMVAARAGSVLVSSGGRHVGILTEKDVVRAASEGRPPLAPASEAMSSPLITIGPGETVWEAAEKMVRRGIHKLPVAEGGRVVGIVTATDLVRLCSLGSDSGMRRICDQILTRMRPGDAGAPAGAGGGGARP